jgi:hypothetical protein
MLCSDSIVVIDEVVFLQLTYFFLAAHSFGWATDCFIYVHRAYVETGYRAGIGLPVSPLSHKANRYRAHPFRFTQFTAETS